LHQVQFQERREVELDLIPTKRLPNAIVKAKVKYEDRQAWIEISYDKMKPAVLFYGDVASYVVWAITTDGSTDNLGELWVRQGEDSGNVKFSTGLKSFALLVTAETHPLVKKPSEMIIFVNAPGPKPQVISTAFKFSAFEPAPKVGLESLEAVKYDGTTPLDLLQAQKVYELAGRMGCEQYAAQRYREAGLALAQATQMSKSAAARRGAEDYSRRSTAASSEAIRLTVREIEAKELEAKVAQRRQEIATLESRAADADKKAGDAAKKAAEEEARATRAEAAARQAQSEAETGRRELERLKQDRAAMEREKSSLSTALDSLRKEQTALQQSMADLAKEKELLGSRLQDALSKVADTQTSARGLIVNLPDILFDVNKATLKPEAKLVISKLAGILLIMRDLNLRVEGHTDSTGTDARNQQLSAERADSVLGFLRDQGIEPVRMTAAGYGKDRPVADNSTVEGRRRNRRVEIIIAEGIVKEQAAPAP
jgi:outer membrane protein OmpA-like peptidoglycan-associated protein